VERGAASDGPQLVPAIERVTRRAGRMSRAVTADRGYGQAAVEHGLHTAGVRTVAIPARPPPLQPARPSSMAAASASWSSGEPTAKGGSATSNVATGDRTRLDGRHGAAIWCGHGVLAPATTRACPRWIREDTARSRCLDPSGQDHLGLADFRVRSDVAMCQRQAVVSWAFGFCWAD
jgi:transposase, IS5 family